MRIDRTRANGARGGFTLLEIIVAVAVVAVVAAMAAPAFDVWLKSQNLGESVEAFRMNLVKARTRAMVEGRTYRVAWEVGGSAYRIAPDELEDWPDLAGSSAGPLYSDAAGLPGWTLVDYLKESIGFAQGAEQAFILFRPNGTASILAADGSERSQIDIAIANQKGNVRMVRLRAVTGGTTVFNP